MATIGGGTDDATIEDTVKVITEDVDVSIADLTKKWGKLTVSFGGPPKDEHVILTNGEKTLYVNARTSRRCAKKSKVTLIDMSCDDLLASYHGQTIHVQSVLCDGIFRYNKGIELTHNHSSVRNTKLIRWISFDHLIIVVEKSNSHYHYDWDVKKDHPILRWITPKISGSLTDFDVSWDDKYCLLTSDKEMMLFSSITETRRSAPLVTKKIEAQAATFMKEGSVIALIQVTYRAGDIIVEVKELLQPDLDSGISPRHWDLHITTCDMTCQNVSHCHYYDERLYVLTRNTLHVISVNLSSGPGGLMPLTRRKVSDDYILRAKGFHNTLLTCVWTTPTRTRPKLKSIRRINIEYVDVGEKDDTPTVEDEALPNETAVGQVDPVAEAQNDDDNSANVGSGKKDDDATHTQAEVKMEVPTTGSDRTAKQNDVANDYVDATDDDKFDGDEEDDGTHHDSNGEEKKTELDEYDNARASGRVRQVEEEAAEEPIVATTTDINPLGHLLFGYGSNTETDDESDEALSTLTDTNSLNASNLVEDEVSSSNTMGEVVDQTPQDRTDNIDGNLNASLEQASKNAPINREVVSPSAAKPPAKGDAIPISSYLESDGAVVTSPGTSNVTQPPHAGAPSDEDGLTTRLISFPSSQQNERNGNDQRRNDQHVRVVVHLPVAADNKNAGGAISEDNADGNDLAASDEEVESSEIDDDATLSYHGESSEGGEKVEEEAEFPTRGGDRTMTQDDVSAEHEPSNEDRSNATAGNPNDDSSMDLAENPPVQNFPPEEGDVAPRNDMADVDSGEDDVAESTGSENTLDSDAQPDEVEDAHSVQEGRNAPIREVIYVLSDSSFAEEESDSDSTYTDSSSVTHGRGAVIDLTSDSSTSHSSSVTPRSRTNEQREDENEHPFDQFDSGSDTEGQGQESGAEQPAVQQLWTIFASDLLKR